MDNHIRYVRKEDCTDICNIYNYYVENTIISFEEQKISEKEMEGRISDITKSYPWIVYELDGEVVGYAYVNKWKERSAYRFTAEDTIYVQNGRTGQGIGRALLGSLLEIVEEQNIRVLMSVIALPNEKSVRLHEGHGFKKVAHFTKVGYKNREWIDVGYWELQIEKNQ
jgi:phosphinothricin acetyltransferase